jgi:hypothetical protein
MGNESTRGVRLEEAKRLLLGLPNVVQGRAYRYEAFLLNGQFLARFRDDDTVLVLRLATIDDREFLMRLDPRSFFFTEHYRNYATVLVRLAQVPPDLLTRVVQDSWNYVASQPPPRQRPKRASKARRQRRR